MFTRFIDVGIKKAQFDIPIQNPDLNQSYETIISAFLDSTPTKMYL
jgi:hypothetical protein